MFFYELKFGVVPQKYAQNHYVLKLQMFIQTDYNFIHEVFLIVKLPLLILIASKAAENSLQSSQNVKYLSG